MQSNPSPYQSLLYLAGMKGWKKYLLIAAVALLLIPLGDWLKSFFYFRACNDEKQFEIQHLGTFRNPLISESSGLCSDGRGNYLTMNDDSDPCLYRIGPKGEDYGNLCLSESNRDWEEICRAPDGRIFVGDFGNNLNFSKDLLILIIHPGKVDKAEKLLFSYEDQQDFPPLHPLSQDFDCEAMVYDRDSLWLFTKNKFGERCNMYVLPARKGTFIARKSGELSLNGKVTSASLRNDGKELALLVYRKIYFFSLRNGLRQLASPDICLPAPQVKQSEAICYISKDSLLLSNEQGNLYLIKRK